MLLGVLAGGSLIIFEKVKGKKIISKDLAEYYSSIFFTVLMFVSSIHSFYESGATLISLVFAGFFIAGIIMVGKSRGRIV